MKNLEAKFRLLDLDAAAKRARQIGFIERGVLDQRDTFFKVPRGKLKLRREQAGAWLIHYERKAQPGLMLSSYRIVPVVEPDLLYAMLAEALGVLAEVRKERALMVRRNFRLHLDRVEGLGSFGEIEAVLGGPADRSGAVEAQIRAEVEALLAALGIPDREMIAQSYFELVRAV